MSKEKNTIKYFVYARKSTEGDERQALSIDSQIEQAKKQFGRLDIVEVLQERKSAFTPHNRPVFAEMIGRIENGEAQGIIAWHPDRLSRNEIDGATITYMIREGKIQDLKFGSYTFDNSPEGIPEGIMMLQMALSQSQYSSAKLSKDVKRGLEKKAQMGWLPGVAPSGYLNDKYAEKGSKKIVKDSKRFHLIKKMWKMMLSGNYTPPQILDIANDKWGYRTVKRRKEGGRPMSRSSIYKIFTNPFYAGIFKYGGETWEGRHEPMITLEEFDRVQMLLGGKGKPRPQKRHFAFTGMIRCGECGCLYTAETKKKVFRSTGKIREYTYYHCTKRKRNIKCTQRTNIREERLETMIDEELRKYTIRPEFREWALEALRKEHRIEAENRNKVYKTQQGTLMGLQKKEDRLIDMRCSDLLNDEEYKAKKEELKKQRIRLKAEIKETEGSAEKWMKLTEKTFDFATYARINFANGDLQKKKEILAGLGSNPIIKDGKLLIEANEWLHPIKNSYPELEEKFTGLELAKPPMNKAKTEALASVHNAWLRGPDSNRQPID